MCSLRGPGTGHSRSTSTPPTDQPTGEFPTTGGTTAEIPVTRPRPPAGGVVPPRDAPSPASLGSGTRRVPPGRLLGAGHHVPRRRPAVPLRRLLLPWRVPPYYAPTPPRRTMGGWGIASIAAVVLIAVSGVVGRRWSTPWTTPHQADRSGDDPVPGIDGIDRLGIDGLRVWPRLVGCERRARRRQHPGHRGRRSTPPWSTSTPRWPRAARRRGRGWSSPPRVSCSRTTT